MALNENLLICQGSLETTPQEAGYDASRIHKINALFMDLIEKQQIQSASYTLARNGKVFACHSMGKLRNTKDSVDMMPDAIRRIASITKVFTSIAIMKLIEDGKIHLYQSVSEILSEFSSDTHKNIKIFHLLTHTSGLSADPGYFKEPYPSGWGRLVDQQESWLKAALSGPLQSPVGATWNYCSTGFTILGEIISRVSGMYCEEYITENIIKPLGMEDTYFSVPESKHSRVCSVYDWNEQNFTEEHDRIKHPPRTGGGIYSTPQDLTKLANMLLGKGRFNGARILGRKAVEAMTRNQLQNSNSFHWGDMLTDLKYGLGISLIKGDLLSLGTLSHEGAGRCAFFIDPTEQFSACFFTPTVKDWVPEAVIHVKAVVWSGLI